jgi:ABC-type glycerol-3-phosphate transport system permease component
MAVSRAASKLLRQQAGNILTYAGLLLLIVVFLFPILWILGISFKDRLQTFTNPPLFLWEPTLANYGQCLAGRSSCPR